MNIVEIIGVLKPGTQHVVRFKNNSLRFRLLNRNSLKFLTDVLPDWTEISVDSIVLVDKFDEKENVLTSPTLLLSASDAAKLKSLTSSSSVDDVDGSPLKVQFLEISSVFDGKPSKKIFRVYANNQQHDVDVGQFSTSFAKSLLGLFNVQVNERACTVAPIWIVCDGQDSLSTVFVGGFVKESSNPEEVQVNDPNSVELTTFDVTSKRTKINTKLESLNDFLANQLKTFSRDSTIRSNVFGRFDIFDEIFKCSLSDEENPSKLSITGEWVDCRYVAEKPPINAKMCLHVCPSWGDSRLLLSTYFDELSILLRLFDRLNMKNVERLDCSAVNVDVVGEIKDLIESTKRRNIRDDRASSIGVGIESNRVEDVLTNCLVFQRQNFDFTERLWQILKNCQTYDLLIECFRIVFDSLQAGVVQPWLHVDNTTKVARLIRDAFGDKLEYPILDGSTPLRLLLEIGADKIFRDYSTIFCESNMVQAPLLKPFAVDGKMFNEKAVTLKKLHWCLQVLVMARGHLSLSPNAFRKLMNAAFNAAGKCCEDDLADLNIQLEISTEDIKSLIEERWINSVWRLTVWTEDKRYPRKSYLYHFSQQSPFGHVEREKTASDDDVYLTQVSKIENNFLWKRNNK